LPAHRLGNIAQLSVAGCQGAQLERIFPISQLATPLREFDRLLAIPILLIGTGSPPGVEPAKMAVFVWWALIRAVMTTITTVIAITTAGRFGLRTEPPHRSRGQLRLTCASGRCLSRSTNGPNVVAVRPRCAWRADFGGEQKEQRFFWRGLSPRRGGCRRRFFAGNRCKRSSGGLTLMLEFQPIPQAPCINSPTAIR